MKSPISFTLPDKLSAKEPPEMRNIARDGVRLLVIDRKKRTTGHTMFANLVDILKPNDLLVFNSSRTLPAAISGCQKPYGPCVEVRLAEHLSDDTWLALILCKGEDLFACGLQTDMVIHFGLSLKATVYERSADIPRLWKIRFSTTGSRLIDLLYKIGEPIRYEYLSAPWPLEYYQNVFATTPGSAEMPSAGRAFTWKLLFDLKKRGIETTNITLHTGLSSFMDDQLDKRHLAQEEEYIISESTSQIIAATKKRKGSVIAVGTTCVRALESAADDAGFVKPIHGYTKLKITADHKLKVVDGLITGLHEPEASHLDLLNAFLPAEQIEKSYGQAIEKEYLWHEFGDLNLII